jgi:hypothetical protein
LQNRPKGQFPPFFVNAKEPVTPVNVLRRGYIKPEIPRFRAFSAPETPQLPGDPGL